MADSRGYELGNPGKHAGNSTSETTIVGARPPGRSQPQQGIPRGIEVLIKKASVDAEFRTLLLEKRSEAAAEIDLDLSAAEAATLNAVPRAQIEKIIENAKVPDEQRRVFLGKIGAAMLAFLGLALPGCDSLFPPMTYGLDADEPWNSHQGGRTRRTVHVSAGISPDRPRPVPPMPEPPMPVSNRVLARVPWDKESLKLEVVDEETDVVAVLVKYECLFERAELWAFVSRNDREGESTGITCQPHRHLVSKGRGEAQFRMTGKGQTTHWVVAKLLNRSSVCLQSRFAQNRWPDDGVSQPGEYFAPGCVVWRLAEFRKEWSAPVRDRVS